jgi:hypothetical protein
MRKSRGPRAGSGCVSGAAPWRYPFFADCLTGLDTNPLFADQRRDVISGTRTFLIASDMSALAADQRWSVLKQQ